MCLTSALFQFTQGDKYLASPHSWMIDAWQDNDFCDQHKLPGQALGFMGRYIGLFALF